MLADFGGIQLGHLSFVHLGVPLFKVYLQVVADSILSKFDRWRGKHLFMVGRVCLVNSMIASSFIHTFMVYKWPSRLLCFMEKCIHNFVWIGLIATRKLVSVS